METNKIYQGNALEILKQMPSESVNCVMTSPPYWALRDYKTEGVIWDGDPNCEHEWEEVRKRNPNASGGQGEASKIQLGNRGSNFVDYNNRETKSGFCKKCGAWKGSLGLEPTFELYIKHLCDIFDEVKRVLRKDGSCWVNIGDTYYSKSGGKFENDNIGSKERNESKGLGKVNILKEGKELPQKSLCNIPARFSIEMQNRGWILRNVIIWHKPNTMPSSIKDRFTIDFEYLFFFVKSKKYFFEQQFEPVKTESIKRMNYKWDGHREPGSSYVGLQEKNMVTKLPRKQDNVPSKNSNLYKGFNDRYEPPEYGRNKRTVWTITTKGFRGAHFATFPESLCETPIKAGCPEFVCNKCGKPREPIYESQFKQHSVGATSGQYWKVRDFKGDNTVVNSTIQIGLTDCGCNAGFSKGIVLDPFFGVGTTGLVALKQNKNFIGIELNPEYVKIAEARIKPYLVPIK